MGEAKRRKLLDPTWGKADLDSYKEAKEARENAHLVARVKRDVPDLPEKISSYFGSELARLTDSQQDQFLALLDAFNANAKSHSELDWLVDFSEMAKSTVDLEVFHLFASTLLALDNLI